MRSSIRKRRKRKINMSSTAFSSKPRQACPNQPIPERHLRGIDICMLAIEMCVKFV